MIVDEIKKEMQDFKEIKAFSSENKIIVSHRDIPLEPDLMGYLFKNILGFNVVYHVF